MERSLWRKSCLIAWVCSTLGAAAPAFAQTDSSPASADVPFECSTRPPVGSRLPRFSGYQASEENDSIIKKGGDERYTQGLRVSFNFERSAVPCWFQKRGHSMSKWIWPRAEMFHTGLSLTVGHSLYTPRLITTRTLDANDRGFSDFNYLGTELSLTADNRSVRHIFDFSVGALGHAGLARGAQGGLHALKLHRIPKGWETTKPGTIGLNFRYRLDKRFLCTDVTPNCTFDVTVGDVLEAGNVRTSFGLHATARAGWALSGFPAAVIPTAADRSVQQPLEIGALVGYEGRGILHTSLVQPSPNSVGFETEPFVLDRRVGFYVRYEALRITYQFLHRSAEFKVPNVEKRDQDFASISVSFEPSLTHRETPRPWLFREWQFELGMGTNFAGPEIDTGRPRGITAQIAARKGLAKGFDIGLLDMASGTVETTPTPGQPGDRSDLLLRQRSVTLGWGTRLKRKDTELGRIAFRVGSALWGGDARIETIFHPRDPVTGRRRERIEDRDFEAPRGGWLVGAQYLPPLEPHLSIGLDAAYHSVKVTGPVPGLVQPRFFKLILFAQVRP